MQPITEVNYNSGSSFWLYVSDKTFCLYVREIEELQAQISKALAEYNNALPEDQTKRFRRYRKDDA